MGTMEYIQEWSEILPGAGGGTNGEAYYNNFMIPFGKSIVVTAQHLGGEFGGFYMVRFNTSISCLQRRPDCARDAKQAAEH